MKDGGNMQEVHFNPHGKPIVLWGCGRKTQWLLGNNCLDFPIEFIVDSSAGKEMLYGIKIVSPAVVERWADYYIVVIPKNYQEEIFSILCEKGLQYGENYIGFSELTELYRESYEMQMLADISAGYKVMALPVFPIGDICTILSFLKAYREKVNQPLALYAGNIKNRDLLQLCTEADKVELFHWEFMPNAGKDGFFKRNGILDLTDIFALYKGKGDKYCDSPGMVKAFFGLQQNTQCNRIGVCNFGSREHVEAAFEQYKLTKGKTVFLVPYGDWLGSQVVSGEFWEKLCSRLRQEGYVVVFNAEKEIIPGVPSLFLNVLDIPLFAEMCGNVVGARTGLINYIAFFTDVMIQAIWPRDDNPLFCTDYWKAWCGFGGIDLSKRSEYFMEHGLSIRGETGREHKLMEFIYEEDERDIEFIIGNLEKKE